MIIVIFPSLAHPPTPPASSTGLGPGGFWGVPFSVALIPISGIFASGIPVRPEFAATEWGKKKRFHLKK